MTQKELTLLNLGDSLDNISNIDPRGYGVCHILYPASREYTGGPLCMNAAGKLCDTLKQDDLVYIMTGFVLPPFGSAETDGVISSVLLARSLVIAFGAKPVIVCQEENVPAVKAMAAVVAGEENVGFTFNRYINMVALVLARLGVDARTSGRNDILIGDRKVSGNAFYRLPGRSIVHGTMLYDTDMENMVGSITPTGEKLLSKGVESVRQRIALLKDYVDIDIEEFKRFVRENLCDGVMTLTKDDVMAIETLEKEYLSPEFIYGNNPRYTVVRRRRIEGVGEIEARVELKNGVIKGLNLVGDYLLTGDLDGDVVSRLRNVPLTREAVMAALPGRMEDVIMNLSRDQLASLLLGGEDGEVEGSAS